MNRGKYSSELLAEGPNIIENMNRIIRKYTKTKAKLPYDQAVEKVVYLALRQISKK